MTPLTDQSLRTLPNTPLPSNALGKVQRKFVTNRWRISKSAGPQSCAKLRLSFSRLPPFGKVPLPVTSVRAFPYVYEACSCKPCPILFVSMVWSALYIECPASVQYLRHVGEKP